MSTQTDTPTADPFVVELAKKMNSNLGDILKPDPTPEVQTDGPIVLPQPVGWSAPAVEAPPNPTPTIAPPAPTPAPSAPTPTPTPTPPTPAPVPPVTIKRKEEPTPPTPTPQKKEPTAEEKAKAELDSKIKALDSQLTEEQKDKIELARFAEAKGRAGFLKQTVEYIEKTEALLAEKPDISDEEFATFIKENQPKLSAIDERKLRDKMIEENIREELRKEKASEIEPISIAVKKMEAKPIIEAKIAEVTDKLTKPDAQNGDLQVIDPAVAEAIKTKGYKAALEEFDIDAQILQGTRDAVELWVKICYGIESIDKTNPTHAYLINFLNKETANLLRQPKQNQIIAGRQFVPIGEYLRISSDEPDKLDSVWSFTDMEMVSDMIANEGLLSYNTQVKKREKAGWKREPKQKPNVPAPTPTPTPQNTPPPPLDATGSPRGGGRPIPGAAEGADQNKQLLQTLPHLAPIIQRMDKDV